MRAILFFLVTEDSMKRVAIYLRVSTSKQDTDNQRRELEAVAERSDWKVVKVYEDAGISGAKGSDQRPGLDAMMKAVMRDGVLFPDDQTAVRHRDSRSKPDQAIGWGRTDVPDSINVKGSTTRSRRGRQAELETRGVIV